MVGRREDLERQIEVLEDSYCNPIKLNLAQELKEELAELDDD